MSLTLPGREYFNYSRPGRVWLVTSRLGTGKSLTFFYSVLLCVDCRISASATEFARAGGTVRQGRRHGPPITKQISPGWVTLLQPARQSSVLGHLSSLRRHWVCRITSLFGPQQDVQCTQNHSPCEWWRPERRHGSIRPCLPCVT